MNYSEIFESIVTFFGSWYLVTVLFRTSAHFFSKEIEEKEWDKMRFYLISRALLVFILCLGIGYFASTQLGKETECEDEDPAFGGNNCVTSVAFEPSKEQKTTHGAKFFLMTFIPGTAGLIAAYRNPRSLQRN